jgi:hypothetical protein
MDHKYYIVMSVCRINQEVPFHATTGSPLSHSYKHSVRNSVNKKRGKCTVLHFLAAISSFPPGQFSKVSPSFPTCVGTENLDRSFHTTAGLRPSDLWNNLRN